MSGFLREYVEPSTCVTVLHDVFLDTSRWIVFANDGTAITETVRPVYRKNFAESQGQPEVQKVLANDIGHAEEPLILAFTEYHLSYGHWHHDVLASLVGVQSVCGERYRIPCPVSLSSFQKASLEALGIEFQHLWPLPPGRLRCKTLVLCNHVDTVWAPFTALRKTFDLLRLKLYDPSAAMLNSRYLGGRYYISRLDATKNVRHPRTILNEEDLCKALEKAANSL